MYTGIVQGVGKVVRIEEREVRRITVRMPLGFLRGAKRGASIALDGVCLTLVRKGLCRAQFDIMAETMERTTLGEIMVGDLVNVERSMQAGDEIGGHPISGHVEGMAQVVKTRLQNGTTVLRFRAPQEMTERIHEKGFIALNGASLTVTNFHPEVGEFDIFFIPETLNRTTFALKNIGDFVNIESYRPQVFAKY